MLRGAAGGPHLPIGIQDVGETVWVWGKPTHSLHNAMILLSGEGMPPLLRGKISFRRGWELFHLIIIRRGGGTVVTLIVVVVLIVSLR